MIEQSNYLPYLAARIRVEHEATHAALKSSVEHGIAVGELLIEAKAKVPHGQWLPWLKANCAMSDRAARDYMRLARLGVKTATVADLGLRATLKRLADRRKMPDLSFKGQPGAIWLKGNEAGKEVWDLFFWSHDGVWMNGVILRWGEEAFVTDRPMKADLIPVTALLRAVGAENAELEFVTTPSRCPDYLANWMRGLNELHGDILSAA